MVGTPEPAGGRSARVVTALAGLAGLPFPAGGRSGTPAHSRELVLERLPMGNPFLPHDRREGARAGHEHEHRDLMECRELRTLGNLVRARAELGRVTAGWAAVLVGMTDRAARRAKRDWRALVI